MVLLCDVALPSAGAYVLMVLPGNVALPGAGAYVLVVLPGNVLYQVQVPMFSWF